MARGLNVEVDKILEIACVITDGKLKKLIEGPELVIHQTKDTRDKMGERCEDHRAANGYRICEETFSTRENDWECPKCGNVNFSFRTVCNMRKCNTPKPGSQVAKPAKSSKADMPEGSWKCDKCNNINYPFRTKCNRQNCGADKPLESQNSPTEEENNDQIGGDSNEYTDADFDDIREEWAIYVSNFIFR
ncbi:zinc finger, RanBP2-type [Artemisia annua]|uniref:Zinc finger, RanBP2-type n=1 Tax=Artemisia annua TaxID=35608 RepID=A0A2U1QDS2_ARTAN|nr:zinc finger, RanBP2-type [Artemisia annua]